MKKHIYSCKSGALMVGNDDFTVHLPNGYGGGEFTVTVSDRKPKDIRHQFLVCDIDGKFNVYARDCDKDEVLCELDGTYGVYCNNGNMYFEKWGDMYLDKTGLI